MHNFTDTQECCDKEAFREILLTVFLLLTATLIVNCPKYDYAHSIHWKYYEEITVSEMLARIKKSCNVRSPKFNISLDYSIAHQQVFPQFHNLFFLTQK